MKGFYLIYSCCFIVVSGSSGSNDNGGKREKKWIYSNQASNDANHHCVSNQFKFIDSHKTLDSGRGEKTV